MSNYKKNNKKNKSIQKNYKIESLEPRFLMDAASDESLQQWTQELERIVVPDYWNDEGDNAKQFEKFVKNKNVNEQISGLYKNDDGTLQRASVYDFLEFDKENENFIKLDGATIGSLLDSVKADLTEKMEEIAKTKKITASELKDKISSDKKVDFLYDNTGYYDATINYNNVTLNNNKLEFDVNISFSLVLDSKLYEHAPDSGYEKYKKTKDENDRVKDKGNDFFTADVNDTFIRIESNFDFASYQKSLEFSFVLDGNAENGVGQVSTLEIRTNFSEKKTSDEKNIVAKFGVLKLDNESSSADDLVIGTKWTVDDKGKSTVVSDIGADLSYKINNVDKDFSGAAIIEDTYSKHLYSNDGHWTNNQIEKYADFSMGRILEKLQELSSKLNAIQNGEFYDNNVDFGHLLSTNAHSLVNLSVMFEDVINNPPSSLQELIERMNASTYNQMPNGLKINVTNDSITIPFKLKIDNKTSQVALAKERLEELLHAEVLENKTVAVESSATLVFNLVVPLNSTDMAKSGNSLKQLGLDQTDNQLSSVIGAKALVANKMDYFYDNKTSFSAYVEHVQNICQNKGFAGIEKILNTGNVSYALYYNLDASMANLGVEAANGNKKFDPSNLAEFKSSVANKCIVLKWNDVYEKIRYKELNKEERTIYGKNTIEKIESAVSTLNVIFAKSKNDALKDLKAVAFDDCIVILLGVKKVEVEDSKDPDEKNSKKDTEIKAILENLKEISFLNNSNKKIALIDAENVALKEIWISNELSPAHYNQTAKMTVTVGCETADIEFGAGYFNTASCVADIAASLQEMINKKFHWEMEDLENGISYKPAQLLVDSFEGKIRFVSLQDYSVDFYDDTFAKWLGFETFISVVDSKLQNHVVTATSENDAKKILMDEVVASAKIGLGDTTNNLSDSFELTFVVDGANKSVKLKKSSFKSLKWCAYVAEMVQDQLNSAYGWDADSSKLYVFSHNDKISFKSSNDFTISTTDESVLKWLGFNNYSQHREDGKNVYKLIKYKEIYSEKIDLDNIRNIHYSEGEEALFTIMFDDDSRLVVGLDYEKIVNVNSLYGLASYINQQIKNSHEIGYPVPDVNVSIKNGSLCFRCKENFTIYFFDVADVEELGFASRVVENEKSGEFVTKTINPTIDFKNNVKTEAIEVTVNVLEGSSSVRKTYSLDLSSIVDSCLKDENALKDCTISVLVNKIVDVLNDKIGHNYFIVDIDKDGNEEKRIGIKSVSTDALIDSITDINGYTIASLLGLAGQFGIDTESDRADFYVEASLVDDYLDDSKVPLFTKFSLVMTNQIADNQKVELPVRYGVIGEKLIIDMSGEKCTTAIISADEALFRMKNLVQPEYVYDSTKGNLNSEHEVSVNAGLDELKYGPGGIGYVGDSRSQNKIEIKTEEPVKTIVGPSRVGTQFVPNPNNKIFNLPGNHFYDYTKGDLYADLYAACKSWIEDCRAKEWLNVQLPVLGKTVLEVMGLLPKLAELESLLKTDMCCNTIQELVGYITNKTGITTTAEMSENDTSITLKFVWNTSAKNKCVELDHLAFNHESFGLSGLFKTFLNMDMTFSACVVLKENQALGQIVGDPVPDSLSITGSIDLFAKNISADMVIYSVENGVRKETELQVESQTGKESNISLRAQINEKQNEMYLGGTLYVYRYGGYAGVAKISVAQQNGYENNSSWNGTKEDTSGHLICEKEAPRTVVVWKNNGSVTPDKNIQKGDVLLDFTGVNNIELKQTSLFDKLRQTVDGLSDSVRRMQSSLTATVMNENIRNIPLLGDSIVNIGDSLSFLNTDFVEPFRKYIYKKMDGLNAAVVAQKLYTILGEYILSSADGGLEICGDENNVEWATKKFNRYYKGIQFYEDENEAYWHIRLCTTYSLEKDADFDLGFPGLGLRGEGGVNIALKLVFDFGFGISLKDGAFLLLSNGHDSTLDSVNQKKKSDVMTEVVEQAHAGDDLNLEISITPNAVLKGSLGFLAMNAALDQNKFVLNLGLDLNDGRGFKENKVDDWVNDGNAKPVILIKELLSNISTEANLRGELDLGLKMTLGIGGYGTSAPHMDTGLHVGWSSDFGDGFGSLDGVKFDPIVFDCGSFVKNTVGGIIDKVERVIKPIRPLISFLQSEIPVLNKLPAGKVHMTVLDLVKKFGVKKGMNFGFLDDIIEMDNVVKKLSDIANKGLMLSEWTIYENIEKIQGKISNAQSMLDDLKEYSEGKLKELSDEALAEFNNKMQSAEKVLQQANEKAWDKFYESVAQAEELCNKLNYGPEKLKEYTDRATETYNTALATAQQQYDNSIALAKDVCNQALEYVGSIKNTKEKLENEINDAMEEISNGNLDKYVLGNEYIMGHVTNVEKFVSENMKRFGIESNWVDRIGDAYDAISSGALTINDAVDYAKDFVDKKVDQIKSVKNIWDQPTVAEMSSVQMPEFGGNWEFPILDNPKDEIMKMIMGGHADLVIFDMRPLKFNFDWSKSFPIIGPLCADVGFSFGVDIDLCFGYDTCGVERWAQSHFKNIGALIDGFYVADWDLKTGEDITEVVFHSGVVAGASVGGRFGVNVGLNLNVNMDFRDPNDDGKIRLGEMAEMLSLNPLDTFDVSASISARAYAYLDLFLYRKEWTLWSSGAFDLFKSASEQDALATRSGENLIVNVGEYAKENSVAELKDDGDDSVVVEIVKEDQAKIILGNKDRTYTVKENNLCIYAGEGNDTIKISCKKDVAANFNIFVFGGNGDDNVDLSGLSLANGCFAMVVGSSGKDYIKGVASGTDYLFGDEGCLTYTPESENKKRKTVVQAYSYPTEAGDTDIIIGSEKNSESTSYIFGGAGNDFVVGSSGENYIFADFGRIKKDGGNLIADRHDVFDEGGDDLVYGRTGVDHIYGGAGSDWIRANDGNDEIYGGQGNDVIYGGSGDDSIYGGDGTDVIFGDKPFNDNQFVIARSDNGDKVQLPYTLVPHDLKGMVDADGKYISPLFNVDNGVDVISMFDFFSKYVEKNFPKLTEQDTDKSARNRVEVFMQDLLDKLERQKQSEKKFFKLPDPLVATLIGDSNANNGSDVIDGGNGDDIIFGDDGKNNVDSDREILSGGDDIITGGAGNDFIDGDAGSDKIEGGSGMDVIYGGRGNDLLDGGAGKDFVFGDDGLADYESKGNGQWFIDGGENVFGETIASVGKSFGISNDAKSRNGGGDDTIVAGDGSDFIDGQSGNDIYKVQFMGGSNKTFSNIMDSGDDVYDTMNVHGTIDNDNVLIRASDKGLGMIGLLPNGNDKTALERINYWKVENRKNSGIEFTFVETDFGNDSISIDGTLSVMAVDAGAGEDVFNVGQMYNTKRSTLAGLNNLDVFSDSTYATSEGFLSVGNNFSLTIKGGFDADVFNILHTGAPLSIEGNTNTVNVDTCNIYTFKDEKSNSVIKNTGVISLLNQFSHLNYYGSPADDNIAYDSGDILSSATEIEAFFDIPKYDIYGGEGKDTIHILSAGSEVIYHGNEYDTVDVAEKSDSIKYRDVIENLKNETSSSKNIDVVEYLRVANSSQGGTIETKEMKTMMDLQEGANPVEYGVKLTNKPKGTVYVTLYAPILSQNEKNTGDRDIFFIDSKGKYVRSIVLEFNSKNYDTIQFAKMVSIDDVLNINARRFESVAYDITSTSSEDIFNPYRNLTIYSRDSFEYATANDTRPIWATQVYIADCNVSKNKELNCFEYSLVVNNLFGTVDIKSLKKMIWFEGINEDILKTMKIVPYEGGSEISWQSEEKLDPSTEILLSFVNLSTYLDNQSILLFHMDINNTITEIGFTPKGGVSHILMRRDYYEQGLDRDPSSEWFFETQGNQMLFYSKATKELIELTGTIGIGERLGGGTNTVSLPSSYTRIGDPSREARVGFGSVYFKQVLDGANSYLDIPPTVLPGESNSVTSPTPAPAPSAAPVAPVVASSDVAEFSSEVVLDDGLPGFVSIGENETVRFKIPASMQTSSSVALMVNSEDGKSLPALTWSWDDTNKKRNSVAGEIDLSYQVDISDALSEDDFIYVYLHAAKACQFVASALVS